jgi:ABC-type uncharacterized transport system permease subunit
MALLKEEPHMEVGKTMQTRLAGTALVNREMLIRVLVPVSAVGVALLAGGMVIYLSGLNPLHAYTELVKGAFGSTYAVTEVFVRAMPLGFAGLAFALAAKGGLLNIGAEGQIYVGALGGTLVALFLQSLPAYLLLPLAILSGAAFGAMWGTVPGILKAKWNVNEFVNTMLMNYVALYLVNYLVAGPLREPTVTNYPQTAKFAATAQLPVLVSGTRLTIGIILLFVLAIGADVLLQRSTLGYQIRVIGHNPRAASYSGMSRRGIIVLNLALAGALAGIGGTVQVMGVQHRLIESFSPGYGYTGIAVALLGRNHPIGVVISSLFFGILRTGRRAMESYSGVSFYLMTIIEGLIVLAVLVGNFLVDHLLKRRLEDKADLGEVVGSPDLEG